MYLWDVKSKEINRRRFRLGLLLCEADTGKHGLGYDWYYNKSAIFHRAGDKYARLTIYFLFAEVMISLNWGNKILHDAQWERLRNWEYPAKLET